MKLKNVSVNELRRELDRRERGATKLSAQRDRLQRQLDSLMAELADLGVEPPKRRGRPPGRRGPGRPKGRKSRGPGRPKGSRNRKPGRPRGHSRNAMTLMEAMAKGVRLGATVSPAQAALAAKRVGYKSSSKNFGDVVGVVIAKTKAFKRVGRGQYKRVA